MIRSFKSKNLRKFFEDGQAKGLPADQITRIQNRLSVIDQAQTIEDCNVAGFKLHALSGDYKGFHAVWSPETGGSFSASLKAMLSTWTLSIIIRRI